MVQADAPLVERHTAIGLADLADDDAGSPANAVERRRVVVLDRHSECLVEDAVIEIPAPLQVTDRKLDMGNAVEIDHARLHYGWGALFPNLTCASTRNAFRIRSTARSWLAAARKPITGL